MYPVQFSTMIKVLYVSNQSELIGGAARSLRDLISHLDRTRVEPYFASIYHEELAQFIIGKGVPFLQLSKLKKSNPLPFLQSNLCLARFIRKNKVQIIHNNQSEDTFYSFLPGKCTRTPILTHHRETRYYRSDYFFARHVSANISISSWQNQNFLGGRGILIHNGIPSSSIPDLPFSPAHPGDPFVIGLIGRIAPMKGQDVFLRAAKLVLTRKTGLKFLIVGDDSGEYFPDYLNGLKLFIEENHLTDAVKFTGYVPSSAQVLPEIDISVVPSTREPFGKVIIESMAFARPVIGTNAGGALDIITPETGLIVPVNDEQALADAICFLIDHPELCSQMGKAGQERVIQHFTIEKTLEKIYAVYEKFA